MEGGSIEETDLSYRLSGFEGRKWDSFSRINGRYVGFCCLSNGHLGKGKCILMK
jgi:hypothetical protein